MGRARRKSRGAPPRRRRDGSGFGMLLVGLAVGSVSTALYFGFVSDSRTDFGSGLKELINAASALPLCGPVSRLVEKSMSFETE